MSTIKNTSGDYTLNVGPTGNGYSGLFTVNSANVYFSGNVQYNVKPVTSDAFFTIAANNVGFVDTGILTQTTGGEDPAAQTFAGLRFDLSANAWQVSSSVYANGKPIAGYQTLSTAQSAPSGQAGWVQYQSGSNSLSSSATLVFDSANNVLQLGGATLMSDIGNDTPTITSGAEARYLYSNPPGSGGTGLYVLYSPPTGSGITEELVSKTKAIVYSLIF
jgi:hypothetical protein